MTEKLKPKLEPIDENKLVEIFFYQGGVKGSDAKELIKTIIQRFGQPVKKDIDEE